MNLLEPLAIAGHVWAAHRLLRAWLDRPPRGAVPALTVLLAIGSASAACFVGALLLDARPWPRVLVDAVYLGLVRAAVGRRPPRTAAAPPAGCSAWLLPPLVFGAIAAGIFYRQCQLDAHGLHDATAMWNHKARLLYHAPDEWLRVLREWQFIPHADYPLLLSAWNARLFFAIGAPAPFVPALTQAAVLAAGALLAWSALRELTSPAAAGFGVAAMLGLPEMGYWAGGQLADVPLAVYLLAAVAAVMLGLTRGEGRWLLVAGLCAGWGGWTKNEGVLHAACLAAAGLVMAWRRRSAAELGGAAALAWFAAGLVVPCAVTALYKQAVPIANDMLSAHRSDEILRLLADPQRYRSVGAHLLALVWTRLGAGLWYAFAATVVLRRWWLGRSDHDARAWRWPALALAGMHLTVLLAYVATVHPDPLRHMDFSADRLVLQLWPATVLTAVLWSSGPQHAAAPAQVLPAGAGA
jgi:hypothetical protein